MLSLRKSSPRPCARQPKRDACNPKQAFVNGDVHNWYRSILGYSDQVVRDLLDEFVTSKNAIVVDPFCGAGTTLVECKKRGVAAVGIDANPVSCFVTTVKTNWATDHQALLRALDRLADCFGAHLRKTSLLRSDPAYRYLESSGMIARGWITERPLLKVLAIKAAISELRYGADVKNALRLALLSELVYSASNIKFGPELYCGPCKTDVDVLSGFRTRAIRIATDLLVVSDLKVPATSVILADARQCGDVLQSRGHAVADAVICSPPYPTEHDYTRNGRLELALMEHVIDRESLRNIKRRMIRSHTKGIYKGDSDGLAVQHLPVIRKLVKQIEKRTKLKSHGFAELYPTVVQEYFGGMARHFAALHSRLAKNAICAYVVGDQASYLQVHIPTAEILRIIAKENGYRSIGIRHWRRRWSTTTERYIDENILLLRRT